MATYDTFQNYKDACDSLEELCDKVIKHKETFVDMAKTFQGWLQLYEPVYWKIDEADMEELTRQVQLLAEKVQVVIGLESSNVR